MIRHEKPILTAVAYPPTMLFVPVELAGGNVAINIMLMVFGTVILDLSPLIWLFTSVAGHVILLVLSFREPHIVMMMRALGTSRQQSRNIVKPEGVKYVP